MAPTHILTGLASIVIVGRVGGPTPDAVDLAAFMVGSLAPDVDGQGVITKPGTILRRFLGRELANVLDAIGQLISCPIRFIFGHPRFHPLTAHCLSILAIGAYLNWPWLMWFGGGYTSHLLGDALTAGGIPIWSPVSSKRVSLSRMKTGSRTEAVPAGVLFLLVCGFGWALLPEQVKHTHRQLYEVIVNS